MLVEIFKAENPLSHDRAHNPSFFTLFTALMNLKLHLHLSKNVKMSGSILKEVVDGGYGNHTLLNVY